jgi:hypothetical protein
MEMGVGRGINRTTTEVLVPVGVEYWELVVMEMEEEEGWLGMEGMVRLKGSIHTL